MPKGPPSINDKGRPQRGFVKNGRLRGRGFGEIRTAAKFWEFSTKFDINLDKNN